MYFFPYVSYFLTFTFQDADDSSSNSSDDSVYEEAVEDVKGGHVDVFGSGEASEGFEDLTREDVKVKDRR